MEKKDIEIQEVQGVSIIDVMTKPESYPDDLAKAVYEVVTKKMMPFLIEGKKRLENAIMKQMKEDGATKTVYINADGEKKEINLLKGANKCIVDNLDEYIKKQGFDPLEFGEYEYKPSLKKAKAAAKFGAGKKEILEKCWKRDPEKIKIK